METRVCFFSRCIKHFMKAPYMSQQRCAERGNVRFEDQIVLTIYFDCSADCLPHVRKKVWTGVVTDPEQAEDEAFPRTVSMTWGDVCSTEVGWLLKRVAFTVEESATGLAGNALYVHHVYAAAAAAV